MQIFDLPITHNRLKSRDDVAQSLIQILDPCLDHLVMGNTGLFIGNGSAHYSPRVALFEGWSRLLWGIVPLEAGGYAWKGTTRHASGLKAGSDPESPYYWGDIPPRDQRMVELAAISLGLLLKPDIYWEPLDQSERNRLARWMGSIEGKAMSDNNWRFFRVLVNLALEKLGEPFDAGQREEDLQFIESLYVGDGWYRDAVPFDNYNPWAFHYYSMIYYAVKHEEDPERCNRFKERAFAFARQYIAYFTKQGNMVPYGRSLTYRFAAVSFFSACAFAKVEVLPWGVMKGIVLRNLRWWFSRPIFSTDGLLTIGYAYPSLVMAEEYNAPGSPYWALKAYLILALASDHPFWQAEEQDLPQMAAITHLRVPHALMHHTEDDDTVMLNAGQYPAFEMHQAAEKYAKFAYSATYGFSASIDRYDFSKTGCDSMLFFSEDGHDWRPRRQVFDIEDDERMVRSSYRPYPDVTVTTWLIPVGDLHIRIHEIVSSRPFRTKEGGFAIAHHDGHAPETKEAIQETGVTLPWATSLLIDLLGNRKLGIVQPAPNLNLMQSTTLVPVLDGAIAEGCSHLACLVGAGSKPFGRLPDITCNLDRKELIIDGKSLRLI